MKRQREQPAMAHQSGVDAGDVSDPEEWRQYLNEDGGGEAAKVDRILALPEKARLRILDFLPIKSVIRMGSLSSGWRELYRRDVSVKVTLPHDSVLSLEERRLRCFSLLVKDQNVKANDFNFCLEYAGKCSSEVIHIDNQTARQRCFRFQQTSRHLVRLSLIRVGVGEFDGNICFPMLEEIHINAGKISSNGLSLLVAACPLLRVLDLRKCTSITRINVEVAGAHLMNLTVMDCDRVRWLSSGKHLRLHSFRYSGKFLTRFSLPANDLLTDLFISFSNAPTPLPLNNSFRDLPDLSNLTVLTLCETSLQAMCISLPSSGAMQKNLTSLRELQLLMSKLEPSNLSNICAFLNTCCRQLEKLFVQLPEKDSKSTKNDIAEMQGVQQEGFKKLTVVKMTKFKYDPNEIQLLKFLFNKAKLLERLILVCPKPALEERRLQLQHPANVQLTVRGSDHSTLKSFHSDLLPKK